MYALLQLPNAGDDLQAIKKGVMELADLVVINKADIDPHAATRAQAQIASSLRLLGMHGHVDPAHPTVEMWQPRVMQLSALKGSGLDEFWQTVSRYRDVQQANGQWATRRRHQALAWMWDSIHAGLRQRFSQHAAVRTALPALTADVEAGQVAASTAARQLLGLFTGEPGTAHSFSV
jgi:LAO/AO transport system kinase